jgi:integrase
LADKQSEINRDDWIDPDAAKVLLQNFGNRWLTERGLEESTRERYESAFRLHVVPYLGELPLSDVKEGRIRSWRKALVDKKVGQPTQAKAYRVLHAILNTAVDDRVLRRNPCRMPNGGKEESAERVALSIDEVFAVADAIKPRYRVLVLFGAFTSLRFGELAALQQNDIDVAGKTVDVRKSQAELKNGRRFIKGPKSAAGVREVAIPQIVLDELKGHLDEYAESGDDGYVFVGPLGGRLRRHNFRKIWLEAVAESKIKKTDVHSMISGTPGTTWRRRRVRQPKS